MQELPSKYTKLVDQYKPIEVEGFTLYPFGVDRYEEYLIASRAIGYMQQQLPIELMTIPLLSAFFQMDLQRAKEKKAPTGLFTSAVMSLVLALRLAEEGEDVIDVCQGFVPLTSRDDQMKLKALAFKDADGNLRTITPSQFATIRPVIAAQNGIEIHDVLDNPELVQAEHDLAEKRAPKLDAKISDMIVAAAVLTHVDEEEVFSWPVLKLHRRLEIHRRIMDYQICAIAEGNGASWKGGNPAPHPYHKRVKEGSDSLIGMDKFAGGRGLQAIQESGAFSDDASENA